MKKYNIKVKPKEEKSKGMFNYFYKDGRCSKTYYCKESDCNNKISYKNWKYGQGKCQKCYHMYAKKMGLRAKEKNGKYIDGKWYKEYFCIEPNCNNKIDPKTAIQGKGRCGSCAQKISAKERWQNKEYREKLVRASLKGLKLKPNKPEKILNQTLNKLFLNEYKYVGDGEVIIGGFNPDFINCNGQKKIIELYGDYWHNKKELKNRDKRRIKTYSKYGYKTLIVWEHELKDLKKVKERIISFNII